MKIKRLIIIAMICIRPFKFIEWVNSKRCHIQVNNDPDGRWRVTIGSFDEQSSKSLRLALKYSYKHFINNALSEL